MSQELNKHLPPFHQRFAIKMDIGEGHRHFINRVKNQIWNGILPSAIAQTNEQTLSIRLGMIVANALGKEYSPYLHIDQYIKNDFFSCLIAIECVYEELPEQQKEWFERTVMTILSQAEVDLGVTLRNGVFRPSGAKLLDEALVNDNLKWLTDKGYHSVLVPFEKGLRHFLEAMQKPERLTDTITDIYESVEALAKKVTGKDKDLSANAEAFISKLKLGDYYKKMLKDYVDYANEYRHAAELGKGKKPPSRNEVEAFIYTSGLLIRLAIQQI